MCYYSNVHFQGQRVKQPLFVLPTLLAYFVVIHLLIKFPTFLKYKTLPLYMQTPPVGSNHPSLHSRSTLTAAGKY